MPNQLAIGAAGGSVSTFVISLLHTLLTAEEPRLNFQLPELDCVCPSNLWEDQPHIPWFLGGILCGLLSGPILDLLWVCRERWRRFILARLLVPSTAPSQRHLYKVLHE